MPKRRVYKVYGGFGTGITIDDEAGPFLSALADSAPTMFARAARHVAYTMQGEIKAGIVAGSLRGSDIPQRKILSARVQRRLRKAMSKYPNIREQAGYMLRKSNRFEGAKHGAKGGKSLSSAIGYEQLSDGAVVGWLSKTAPMWGKTVQEARFGFPANRSHRRMAAVTPKQRKFFATIGVGMWSGTKFMKHEPADLIAPYYNKIKTWIPTQMESRVAHYLKQTEAQGRPIFKPYGMIKSARGAKQYTRKWWEGAA